MSRPRARPRSSDRSRASVFAALGDDTRLTLVGRLSSGPPQSISRLARGWRMTRPAITKHLRVLERAGVVHGVRVGREQQFAFRPAPLKDAQDYLARVSDQWDRVLLRLKAFVEE